MRPLWAACIVTLAAGCTDNFSVIITKNAPGTTECAGQPGSDKFKSRGFLDVTSVLPNGQLNPGYVLTPLARTSQFNPGVTTTNAGNPHAHIAYVHGANIEILSNGSDTSNALVAALRAAGLDKQRVSFSFAMDPSAEVGTFWDVIDAEQTAVLEQVLPADEISVVITRSQLFGEIDTSDFESLPFDYPVSLCKGCQLIDVGDCSEWTANSTFPSGGVCGPLQDASMACCTSASGLAVCPAKGTAPNQTP